MIAIQPGHFLINLVFAVVLLVVDLTGKQNTWTVSAVDILLLCSGITYITLCLANCSSRLSIKSFRKQRVPTMDVEQVILLESQSG